MNTCTQYTERADFAFARVHTDPTQQLPNCDPSLKRIACTLKVPSTESSTTYRIDKCMCIYSIHKQIQTHTIHLKPAPKTKNQR